MAFGRSPARHRRVARALLAARGGAGQRHLGIDQLQRGRRVGFDGGDLLAGQLAGGDRVEALDALGGIAVGDGFDLERVQLAEFRDLVERQRGIVQQPHGGGFGHQGGCAGH